MSVDIHKMVQIFQEEIEKEVVDVPLEFKTRFSRRSYSPSTSKTKKASKDVEIKPNEQKEQKQLTSPQPLDANLQNKQDNATVQSVRRKTNMATFHDPEKLLTDINTGSSGTVSKKLCTYFSYIHGQSGHQIKSDSKPNLIYLNNFRFDFNQFNDTDAAYLSAILRKLMKPDVQLTVICASMEQLIILKYVLKYMLGVSKITTFAPSLTGNQPTFEEKRNASKTGKVLLTCYRGFRGCEMDHCILFANPNDNVPKNLYVEMLTRAINFMDIIILPVKKRTFGRVPRLIEIFQKWQREELVFSTNTKLEKIGKSTQIRFSTVGESDDFETLDETYNQNIEQQLLRELDESSLFGHSSIDAAVK